MGATVHSGPPDDIRRHGPAPAIVLAHIRFRCTNGGRLGHIIEHDGHQWWRVSLRDLGDETGLSIKFVRTALRSLGDAITANYLPPLGNRILAYPIADQVQGSDQPIAHTGTVSQGSDQPVAHTGTVSAEAYAPEGIPPCPSGHIYYLLET